MRDLDEWQRQVFGMNEAAPEKPAQGIPTVDLTCQLCNFVSPVMESFEGLFYLEHVDIGIPEDRTRVEVRHYVRPVPRDRK